MIEHYIRNRFQKIFINPVIKPLTQIRSLSPIGVTLIGGCTGMTVLPLLYLHQIWGAISLLLFSGYLDIVDGSLARASNRTSSVGCVLDITCDRLVEFSVIMGLFLINPEDRGFLSLMMLGSVLFCVTSFLVVGIFSNNETEKSFHYSPGLMERAEAFIFFIAMILMPNYFSELAITFSTLVFWTGFYRIWQFYKQA